MHLVGLGMWIVDVVEYLMIFIGVVAWFFQSLQLEFGGLSRLFWEYRCESLVFGSDVIGEFSLRLQWLCDSPLLS